MLVAASSARIQPEGVALAFVLWAAERGETRLVGFLIATTTFPQLVAGPLLGRALDRAGRPERLVALAGLGSAVACGAIAALDLRAAPTVAVALVLAVTTPVLTGGLSSVVIGWSDDPTAVAAWDSAGYNVAGLAAPVLVTITAAGQPRSAFVALGVAGLLAAIAIHPPRSASTRPDGPSELVTPRIRDAAGSIVRSPSLLAVTVATTALSLALGGFEIALAAAVRARDLPAGRTGVLLTALAMGALAGSLSMTRWRRRPDPVAMTLVATAASGALLVALAITAWPTMIVAAVAVGVMDAPLLVGTYRTRSGHAPRHLRSGVFTLAASLKLGAGSLGAVLVALAVGDDPTSAGLVAVGLVGLAAALVGAAVCRVRAPAGAAG